MALEGTQPFKITLPVSANLAQALWNEVHAAGTATQYTFVVLNSSGVADLPASATDIFVGVIQNRPVINANTSSQVVSLSQGAGPSAEIVVIGMTKLVAGGTLTPGEYVAAKYTSSAPATGQAATLQGWGGSYTQGTKKALGLVYPASGITSFASGDLCTALVNCLNPIPAT